MSKYTPVPRFLTEAEAASLLGLTARQLGDIRRDPNAPTPPHLRLTGRAIRYERGQLLEWARTTAAAAARA